MELLSRKISVCDKILARKTSVKSGLVSSFRYYMAYRLGDEAALTKAYRAVAPLFKENLASAPLLLAVAFYQAEMGSLENSDQLITDIKKYSGYHKTAYPLEYGAYLYTSAVLELCYKKNRAAKRLKKKLETFNETIENGYLYLLIAELCFRLQDYDGCLDYLEAAYNKGCRSFLLYIVLHDLYRAGYDAGDTLLFIPFIRWAYAQGILKEYMLQENSHVVLQMFPEYSQLFEEISAQISPDWLLERICGLHIGNRDYSLKANGFYKEADQRQLSIEGLYDALVKSAYFNGKEDIGHYILSEFLLKSTVEFDLFPFIYHVILSKDNLTSLLKEFDLHNDIVKFAVYSLSNDMTGRYYNSIYNYALASLLEESEGLVEKAEKILYNSLFVYGVDSPELYFSDLYLYERERRDMKTHRLKGGSDFIKTPSADFRIFIMDSETKTVINKEAVLKKQIENQDIWLLQYLFQKGYEDEDIYIALSNYYISLEQLPEEAFLILQHTLKIADLSHEFRIRLSAAIGNILSSQSEYEQALAYYEQVDENYLDEKLIEVMIMAFLNAGELEKASGLVIRKREFISDRTLFTAVKRLGRIEAYQPVIADAAYELILNSWFDSALLDIVLKYYNGGQREWRRLSDALSKMSVQEIRLDEIILENSIWMRDFSGETQAVFSRVSKMDPANRFIGEFSYYASYEMLVNNAKPEYETINLLEKLYVENRNRLLAYGLSNMYLTHGISTLNSDEIISDTLYYMEENDFILPVFKEIKDKTLTNPYIEKNQPFIYQCSGNKKVLFNYKLDEEEEFRQKPMDYLKFGIYYTVAPMFYDETVTYFFSEEMERGSISTKKHSLTNTRMNIKNETNDAYYLINNALIFDRMFKYEDAEKLIGILLQQGPGIKGQII